LRGVSDEPETTAVSTLALHDALPIFRVMIEGVNSKGHSTPRKLRGSNKALSGRQLQGAEARGASEEDLGISQGKFIVYSVVRTRSEEHTSELRHVSISYAVFCLKKKS